MKNTIKTGICMMTALTLITASLVGCSVQSSATGPTGRGQTNNSLETTQGPTDVTAGVPTTTTKPGSTNVTMTEATRPGDVDATVPSQITEPTNQVETAIPNETMTSTETTAPVETTVPNTKPTEIMTPTATTEPSVPSTPANTETTVLETTVPHVHSYIESTVAATCTEPGYTQYTCACGDSYRDNYTSASGHIYERTITQPTCTTQGYSTYICSGCGRSFNGDYTDAAHSWGKWEASPLQDSTMQRTCSVCGEVEKEYIHQEEYDVELWEPASADEAAVVQAVLKYINQFRAEEGSTQLTYLPGLSQVSQYRSRQLVTNFTHDAHDMREAAGFYKYGKYTDFAEIGYPEWVDRNYWDDCAREAIGALLGNSSSYSLDQVGYRLANACRESSRHWDYVGSSDYSYVGIGVAYSDGEWFACIQVSDENHD